MRWILGIVVLIILYGSLHPFNFSSANLGDIDWLHWLQDYKQRTTNGDVLSNFLTFIPLGYFAFMSVYQANRSMLKQSLGVLLACVLFALLLQIAQFFLPSRVPTIGDVWINLWGTLCGLAVAVAQQAWLVKHPQMAERWSTSYAIPAMLAGIWLLYQLFPFLLEFSRENLSESTRYALHWKYLSWQKLLVQSVMWFCFLDLLSRGPFERWRWSWSLILVVAVLLLRVLVEYNWLTVNDWLAAMLALVAQRVLKRGLDARLMVGLVVVALCIAELIPWRSKPYPADFSWVPFDYYLSGSMWVNTHLFLEKLYTYGVLIYYLSLALRNLKWACLSVVALVLPIEILQKYRGTGVPELTEIILILLLGFAFYHLAGENWRSQADEPVA